MILIFDFGSQTCHLIGRRLKDLGVENKICDPENALKKIKKFRPKGLIFSGGPASVYQKNAPKINRGVFNLRLPILGICYGTQLIVYSLDGKVKPGKIKEFGKTKIKILEKSSILSGLGNKEYVWMSHGDSLKKLPFNFKIIALSEFGQTAAIENQDKKVYGFLFHPEVEHTPKGSKLLGNFAFKICKLKSKGKPDYKKVINKIIVDIKKKVAKKNVFLFASGGIDSTVLFILLNKALGQKRVLGVHVNNGLLREKESEKFKKTMNDLSFKNFHIEQAAELFISSLFDVSDPEEKRKIIGSCYLEVQRRVLEKFNFKPSNWLLGQGTIYPDFIESGRGRDVSNIKSHHNVGGLPGQDYQLIEPLKYFYKNEVREMGKILGLPFKFVWKEPFPGPGVAVRVLGPISLEKFSIQRRTDVIMEKILLKTPWFYKLWNRFPVVAKISEKEKPVLKKSIVGKTLKKRIKIIENSGKIIKKFLKEKKIKNIKIKPVLLPVKTCGVKGDGRAYEHPLVLQIKGKNGWHSLPYDLLEQLSTILTNKVRQLTRVVLDLTDRKAKGWDVLVFYRIITSQETMTADWAKLESSLLNRITSRVMKDKRIDRVFFDITQKPPGTMEWE